MTCLSAIQLQRRCNVTLTCDELFEQTLHCLLIARQRFPLKNTPVFSEMVLSGARLQVLMVYKTRQPNIEK